MSIPPIRAGPLKNAQPGFDCTLVKCDIDMYGTSGPVTYEHGERVDYRMSDGLTIQEMFVRGIGSQGFEGSGSKQARTGRNPIEKLLRCVSLHVPTGASADDGL